MRTSTLFALASAVGYAAAGVNCNGSSNCAGLAFSLQDIVNQSKGLDENRIYRPGEHIICIEGVFGNGACAFLQGNSAENGHFVKILLQDLLDHGCKKCGSVPVDATQGGNDDGNGILTVNAVGDTGGCNGIC
ncbi:killer toxin [Trichoderma velutinum]